MNITFLGTSSGAPTRQRNVSATAIHPETGRGWVLVDCGEATQHQLQRTRLSPLKLKAILITHIHGDHCYGLPGLLASCQLNGRTEPLVLVGPASVWAYLQAVIKHTELRIEYPLEFVEVSSQLALELDECGVTATRLSHRVECWAYRLDERQVPTGLDTERLQREGVPPSPVYGRLQKGERVTLDDGRELNGEDYAVPAYAARSLVVGGDNDRPDLLAGACEGVHALVHEATYTEPVLQKVGPEPQHSSALRVAQFAQSQSIPALILTHFSPRYRKVPRRSGDASLEDLRSEALSQYQGDLFLAEDFDTFCIGRDGRVQRLEP
ncbi:ribonuclease Z [Marinobacterium stanieri]|uniref:Ribonuclease Z n=1 Tax=Marinobacterium stanieri TaxID=49186 RepID=A0A1N6X3S4_9GAMM|nr:ribonuclease Z [Marinobacterium stanieri]SIQ96998.1 RNAse Z [Marinobacterium stanieri]